MPAKNPRTNLTLPVELDATITKLSELQGIPKARIITELLMQHKPVLDAVIDALEKIKADKANAPAIAKKFAQDMILDGTAKLGVVADEAKKL